MKRRFVFLMSGLIASVVGSFAGVHATGMQDATLFVGKGCGACADVEQQLNGLDLGAMDVQLTIRDVYVNPEDAQLFNELCDSRGISLMERSIPMLSFGEQSFFGDAIIPFLRAYGSGNLEDGAAVVTDPKKTTKISLPVVIGAAIVDAINPCAFAVLIILMTTLLITSTRKKALMAGLLFSTSIFISYFLMGLGLYKVVSSFETTKIFITIIGIIAIILGILNIKDYFWYGKGILMEVPRTWRPKLRKLLESVTSPVGAFFVGFLVSLFLLPCTSGPYIVIISMLGHSETYMSAVWYLVAYNLVFVFPMIMLTLSIYFGLDVDKIDDLRQTNIRLLHLIAGIILLVIGGFILFW